MASLKTRTKPPAADFQVVRRTRLGTWNAGARVARLSCAGCRANLSQEARGPTRVGACVGRGRDPCTLQEHLEHQEIIVSFNSRYRSWRARTPSWHPILHSAFHPHRPRKRRPPSPRRVSAGAQPSAEESVKECKVDNLRPNQAQAPAPAQPAAAQHRSDRLSRNLESYLTRITTREGRLAGFWACGFLAGLRRLAPRWLIV